MCIVVHSRTNPGEHSAIWAAGRAKRCRLHSTQRPHCRRNKIPSCGWVIPCKVFGHFCSLASLLLSLMVSYYFTEPNMEGRDIYCCASLIRCDSLFFVLFYFFGCVFKVCVIGEFWTLQHSFFPPGLHHDCRGVARQYPETNPLNQEWLMYDNGAPQDISGLDNLLLETTSLELHDLLGNGTFWVGTKRSLLDE